MEPFGDVDRNRAGKISSEYPAWYHERHVEDLEESISSIDRQLKQGLIPADKVPAQAQDRARKQARLDDIMKAKPEFTAKEKDDLRKVYGSLGDKISDSMFTRSEMHMGTVDAHVEASRMTKPCITLNPQEASVAKSCGITMGPDRKVSRNAASKPWKLIGRLLGVPTNVEVLRRDSVTEGHKTVH